MSTEDESQFVGEVEFNPDAEDVLIACNGTALFIAPKGTAAPGYDDEPGEDEEVGDWISVGWVTDDGLKWIGVDKGKPRV